MPRPLIAPLLAAFILLAAAPAASAAWRVVSFDRAVTAADRAAVDRAGDGVHPVGARRYAAFVEAPAASALARAPHVRSVRTLSAAEKLDGALRPAAPFARVVRVAGGRRVSEIVALDAVRTPLALSRRDDVLYVGTAPLRMIPEDEGTSQLVAGNHAEGAPRPGYLDWIGTTGIDGRGVRIAVVDTGVDPTHPDLDDRVVEEINYETPNPVGDIDEQGHGTHVAGIVAGHPDVEDATAFADEAGLLYGQGVAPGADIVAMNGLTLMSEADLGAFRDQIPTFARDASRAGAVAWNASWHTGEGEGSGYVETVRVVDGLVRDADSEKPGNQSFTMVFSAGNAGSGEQTLTVPHEAKNIISVASSKGQRASGNTEEISSFSSRGPGADGRVLPTVAAPGETVASARSKPLGGLCFEPADVSPIHSTCSGTSMAAPHVAGAVALVTQWWKAGHADVAPSPAMTKALLVNTATDLDERDVPNNNEGWGRINLGTLFGSPASSRVMLDQDQLVTEPGIARTLNVAPIDPAKPFRATLTWTDAPGAAAADDAAKKRPALVNDLDLTVQAGGQAYAGNVFAAGASVPGGSADRLNNVENVWLDQAGAGPYTVTVSAAALPGDGVPGVGDATDQDYALVLSNARVVEPATAPPAVAPSSAPRPVVKARWVRKGRRTALRRLTVGRVQAGGSVKLSCRGRGCPKRVVRRKASGATMNLTRPLRRARLGRGARVTLRAVQPGGSATTFTWTMRKPGKPRLARR